MGIRANQHKIVDLIVPQHVLLSVYDKTNLDSLVNGILEVNHGAMFYSTGGTGTEVQRILEERAKSNYISVEDFTASPEMEGGLVKTLHPKIHAGLLAERGNPEHEKFLYEEMARLTGSPGVYFDLMVGGLYPFSRVASDADASAEDLRGHIDVGGPTMLRAAAKNWPSVAVLCSSEQYGVFLRSISASNGTNLAERFQLAVSTLRHLNRDSSSVYSTLAGLDFEEDVLPGLDIAEVS